MRLSMRVLKRSGNYEDLSFDKILFRIKKLCTDTRLGNSLEKIDPSLIAQKTISIIYDGVSSSELDEEAARIAAGMSENLDAQTLATRIIVSNLHKSTLANFTDTLVSIEESNPGSMDITLIDIAKEHKDVIEAEIDYVRDYSFTYFGFKTLEKSYLLKKKYNEGMIVAERPQHLYMRVALAIHREDIPNVIQTYHLLSQHYYTHASPTLFNAGSKLSNFSSCFLMGTEDSIEGIFKTYSDCAKISKLGGGIGVHISNIRSKGSVIRGTNGKSDGIIPMLKVYNEVCNYVNQSGKRKGSFAMYIEPYHADIIEFLDLRKNQGSEDMRARDLFYSIWTPDYFMRQVESDGDWYLMCPDECPGLSNVVGKDFDKLYDNYISQGMYREKVKARDIWAKILDAQIETGAPYIAYKDAVNNKCNQKNLGTIKSSNLCSEISLYSDEKEYACCNLCSIPLPKFVKYIDGISYYDFEHLHQVASYTVISMNKVIDNNYYPTPETRYSDKKNRPLGIGIQGLADVYSMMKMPFESKEASKLNIQIFETLYHAVITSSINLAKIDGPYPSFKGSPFSQGKLQFDLCEEYDQTDLSQYLSDRYDWDTVRNDLKTHGIRNSMLTALMPTASTAQIMGNSESFEVITSCIFKRRVLSGEFVILNRYLVKDLEKLGLWNLEMKNKIIAHDGSIQGIFEIPHDIKQLYKTSWEISMKNVISQCRDRGVFIDQMQSMNLYMSNPNYAKLTSMHFYAWKNNLKTGIYYLRSKSASGSAKFSIDASVEKAAREEISCSIDNKDECVMCSS
jgi:ribonucleoside-diphosphate reductase alpha chain